MQFHGFVDDPRYAKYRFKNNLRASFHARQVLTQPSSNQGVIGRSLSKDETMATGGPQYSRRRLEVKPNYSHEEVKTLMLNLVGKAKVLQAENTHLQSLITARKKGFESLQSGKADVTKQIQRFAAQKEHRSETM